MISLVWISALAIMDVLYNETWRQQVSCMPAYFARWFVAVTLVLKSGKGFYVYNADRTKTPVDAL